MRKITHKTKKPNMKSTPYHKQHCTNVTSICTKLGGEFTTFLMLYDSYAWKHFSYSLQWLLVTYVSIFNIYVSCYKYS